MTQTELNKYRAVLEAKQAELSVGLRNREDIAIEKTPDALDEVQLAGERELAIRNLDRESNLLRNVKGALGADCRWQLRSVPPLRGRHQAEAPRRGAVDQVLHPLPGSLRPPRICQRHWRRHGRASAQRGLRNFEREGRGASSRALCVSNDGILSPQRRRAGRRCRTAARWHSAGRVQPCDGGSSCARPRRAFPAR